MQPRDAFEARDEVQLLDVREDEEWVAGHIEGAVHIPMGQLMARLNEVDRERTVVVVCRMGGRSATVADALLRVGYEAHNLEGGMQAWQQAELPFVSDTDRDPYVA